jgi:hypothetical protein
MAVGTRVPTAYLIQTCHGLHRLTRSTIEGLPITNIPDSWPGVAEVLTGQWQNDDREVTASHLIVCVDDAPYTGPFAGRFLIRLSLD